jgi:vacuolar-type H+-ATPase subunit H
MTLRRRIAPLLAVAALAGGLPAGCGEDDVRQGVDEAQQKGEDAAKDARKAGEDAAKKAKKTGEDAAQKAKKTGEDAAGDVKGKDEEETDGGG